MKSILHILNCFFLITLSTPFYAQVVLVNSNYSNANYSIPALNHTPGAGTDRILLFIATAEYETAPAIQVNSVSYGGQAMTFAGSEQIYTAVGNCWAEVEVFYLLESQITAATSTAFTVSYSGTAVSWRAIKHCAITFANVDQTNPLGQISSSTNNNRTNIQTVPVNGNTNDMLVSLVSGGNNVTYTSAPAGFNTIYNRTGNTHTFAAFNRIMQCGTPITPVITSRSYMNRQSLLALVLKYNNPSPPININIMATACNSYSLNGQSYTASGIYNQTITSVGGCDSILTINLTINSTINTLDSLSICPGQSATIHGVNQSVPGIYTQTITTASGCDSISSIKLIVNNSISTTTISPAACNSYSLNGQSYTASGIYTQTLVNAAGCDSILTIELTINNTISTLDSLSVCEGQSIIIHGVSHSIPGIYTQTYIGANGCDSVASTALTVYPVPQAAFSLQPSPVTTNSIVNCIDQSTGASTWNWSFGDIANSSSTNQHPQFIYSDSGYYQLQLIVSNSYGCLDTSIQPLYVQSEFFFYMPNAFTPNEDNINDVFMPKAEGISMDDYEFYVFDRWGNLIFKSTNINAGWNGIGNGGKSTVQLDTYVWKINVKDLFGKKHTYIGHVNLLK